MTIDEAIECERNHRLYSEYHEQLAEWLEELKSYRTSVFSGDMTQAMLKEQYCKAIDDFAEKLMEQQIYDCMLPDGFRTDIVTSHTIDAIAEQLKAGVKE